MAIEVDFNNLKKDYDKKVLRKYSDMKESYLEKINSNPLIYTLYIKNYLTFFSGLTVIEPGKIKNEFFMTKGHKHKPAAEEIYMLISGKGKLIIQDTKKLKSFDLKKNKVYAIPKNSAHRLVNTGKQKLEVLTIYPKGLKNDYSIKFKKRFFSK